MTTPASRLSIRARYLARRARARQINDYLAANEPASRLDAWDRRVAA